MDAPRRTLLSLALICLSSFNSFASNKEKPPVESPNPIYDLFYKQPEKEDPKNIEEILRITDKRYLEITQRNDILFRNSGLQNLVTKYSLGNENSQIASRILPFNEDEEKLIKKYGTRLAKDLFSETWHSIIWADEIEEDVKNSIKGFFDATLDGSKESFPLLYEMADSIGALFRYGISVKGKKADGVRDFPSLSEQRRLEDRKRRERTGFVLLVPELGTEYLFDIELEYHPDGINLKELFGGFETKALLRDVKLFGQDIDNARIKFRTDQRAEVSLTKILEDRWYATVYSEFHRIPNQPDNVCLMFSNEVPRFDLENGFDKRHTSRFTVLIGYDNKNNEARYGFNYLYRW